MHKYILLILIVLSLSFVCSTICWLNLQYPVQKNHCTVYDLVDDPAAMERAILKMGPLYNYTVSPDGTLKVNKGDDNWLVLNYKEGGNS